MQDDQSSSPPAFFRLVNSAYSSQTPVPGYSLVRSFSSNAERGTDLLVPDDMARRLDEEAVKGMRVIAEASPYAESPSRAPAPPSVSTTRRDPKNHVELSSLETHSTAPEGGVHVSLWKPDYLLEVVDRHNAQLTSSDPSDRARDAAILRQLVAAGPWRRCSGPADSQASLQALKEELPHWAELLRLVEGQLRLAGSSRPFSLPPMLLVGRPGVGKTHAARRLAALLDVPFRGIDLAVGQTNSALHGSDRHWANARAGALFELTALGRHANPLVLLDELDKAASVEGRYSPLAPLYSALEPETARCTRDQCHDFLFDASRVMFVGTANSLRGIPPPILSRFHLVHAIEPTLRETLGIARSISRQIVVDKQLEDFKPVPDRILLQLVDRSPRLVRRALELGIARAVAAGRNRMTLDDLCGPDERKQLH